MVVIRESPKKQASTAEQQWPPRSPLDALLSSPSGRKRYQNRSQRDSVSPSPAKRRRMNAAASDEEDEDEETLQLKLQAIEARLKLKKIQRAKEKSSARRDDGSDVSSSRPGTSTSFRSQDVEQPSTVHVPLSPIKTKRVVEPTSPARVLLGIDKGLRAQDVSLKRAASTRNYMTNRMNGSQLSRSNSVNTPKSKTFAERIMESRNSQREKEAKDERINRSRSQGFGVSIQKQPESRPASRGLLARNRDTDVPKDQVKQSRPDSRVSNNGTLQTAARELNKSISNDDTVKEGVLEPYSGFHIKSRKMDHTTLTRTFTNKAIYSIPQLLKEVKSPDYDPPDCESDYVVMGIIASKSTPLDHKSRLQVVNGAGSEDQSHPKFMVIHLTDLKWELDLFLFATGFDSFWTLTPGTVVAILNPSIMPPKNVNSGAFSLKLASSEDTVLEIGTSTDLGFCKAVKRDGRECLAWIDARKTEFCEFHIALKVDKARKGRMEFNSMVGGKTVSTSSKKAGGGGRFGGRFNDNGLLPEGKTYDKTLHETLYIAPKELGFNATRLLDDQDADVNAWQRGCSKEEWTRKREKKQAKEAELARKLGELGSGAGSAYLKARQPASTASASGDVNSSSSTLVEQHDALSLGLLGKKAEDVKFTTSANGKRKRPTTTASASAPVGWGGANKRGLLLDENGSSNLKSTLKEPGQVSPKKSARFMLEKKGIRLPGRESLGSTKIGPQPEDSDDDLEIV